MKDWKYHRMSCHFFRPRPGFRSRGTQTAVDSCVQTDISIDSTRLTNNQAYHESTQAILVPMTPSAASSSTQTQFGRQPADLSASNGLTSSRFETSQRARNASASSLHEFMDGPVGDDALAFGAPDRLSSAEAVDQTTNRSQSYDMDLDAAPGAPEDDLAPIDLDGLERAVNNRAQSRVRGDTMSRRSGSVSVAVSTELSYPVMLSAWRSILTCEMDCQTDTLYDR